MAVVLISLSTNRCSTPLCFILIQSELDQLISEMDNAFWLIDFFESFQMLFLKDINKILTYFFCSKFLLKFLSSEINNEQAIEYSIGKKGNNQLAEGQGNM